MCTESTSVPRFFFFFLQMQMARVHGGGGSMPSLQAIDSSAEYTTSTIDLQVCLVVPPFCAKEKRANNLSSGYSLVVSNSVC